MIQIQTELTVADNTGAKRVECIKVLGGSKRRSASIGDIIVVSIKDALPRAKVKKGDVLYGVIVKMKSVSNRKIGLCYSFNENAVVLLNKQLKPLASRVLGVVPRELRNEKFSKIIALASGII